MGCYMAPVSSKVFDAEEDFRLSELYRLNLLDSPAEAEFDAITQLGKQLFNCAFCTIVLLDDQRQWFKAKAGAIGSQTSKDASFCKYTIQSDEPNVINNATLDPRVKHSPLVTNAPWIRAYLGIPLTSLSKARLGTFCVIDTKAREWSQSEIGLTKKLATIIERLLHRKEAELNLGYRKATHVALHTLSQHARFGSWELREGESLINLSPSLRQMFGLREDLPIHRDWFDRFGVNRPLSSWTEYADQLDGIEPIRFSILRPDGDRAYFEETLYVKEIGSRKTLVGLVDRIKAPNATEFAEQPDHHVPINTAIDIPAMSVLDFLLNRSNGYVVLNNESKIVALFDNWADNARQYPPPVKLSSCFEELDCQKILSTFSSDASGPTSTPLFVKLKQTHSHNLWLKIKTHQHLDGPHQETQRIIEFVQLTEQPEVNRQIHMAHAMCHLVELSTNSGTWACSVKEAKVHPTSQVCLLMNIRPMSVLSKDYFFGRLSEMAQQDINKRIDEVIRRKTKWSLEFESTNAIGDLTTYYCNIEPRLNEQDEVIGLQGVLLNTTELRGAQRKLIELENLSSQLLAHIAEGVIEVNDQGLVTSINHSAYRLLGIPGGNDRVGEPVENLLNMISRSTLSQLTQEMSAHGSSQPTQVYIKASRTWASMQLFAKNQGCFALLRPIKKTRH